MSTAIDDTPILTDADLSRLWQRLMGPDGFGRRSLWLLFLGEDGRPARVIVPIDDIPLSPDRLMVGNVSHIVDRLRRDLNIASVPMLLSRPGPSVMTDSDREWARVLTTAMGQRIRWPIHLATAGHVQVFAPDDLL